MHHHYQDILSRIKEKPRWFDENGVPRYDGFSPSSVADIYCDEAVLLLIACQNCGHEFMVAITQSIVSRISTQRIGIIPKTLKEQIMDKSIHYGDPPNIGCCMSGPTMNSDPISIFEYWSRNDGFEWSLDKKFNGYKIGDPTCS